MSIFKFNFSRASRGMVFVQGLSDHDSNPTRAVMLRLLALALFVGGSAEIPQEARAEWITIRNDTKRPVILQEVIELNQQARRGKPIILQPGETYREYQTKSVCRSMRVIECHGGRGPEVKCEFRCQTSCSLLSIVDKSQQLHVIATKRGSMSPPMPDMISSSIAVSTVRR